MTHRTQLFFAALVGLAITSPAWLPRLKRAQARAEHRACLAAQKTLGSALEMYTLDH